MQSVAKGQFAAFSMLLLALLTTSSHAATAEGNEDVRRIPFCADVEVEPDGSVKIGEVRGVAQALHKLVVTRLSSEMAEVERR